MAEKENWPPIPNEGDREVPDYEGAELPKAGTPAPTEVGLRVVIIPSLSPEAEAKMSKRNYRRTVLDKSRVFGVKGITNSEFLGKSVTDQFLILRGFIPDGWRPALIEPWFEAVKVDEERAV